MEKIPQVEKLPHEEIKMEILQMAEEDQRMRNEGPWDTTVDEQNTEQMKKVVKKIGWPTVSKVGLEASVRAWLLVQHADHDPEFQELCLQKMREAPEGEVRPQDIAYLEDRVRVNTGRPTLYGTQFYIDEAGDFGPRPIEDKEGLDERRSAVGLGSFSEYEAEMRELEASRLNKE